MIPQVINSKRSVKKTKDAYKLPGELQSSWISPSGSAGKVYSDLKGLTTSLKGIYDFIEYSSHVSGNAYVRAIDIKNNIV